MNRRIRHTFVEDLETVETAVRTSAVAGSFYPNSADLLSSQVQDFIDSAQPRLMRGNLIGLISPHAGFAYSGHVAGHAYKQLAGKSFDTVVLIGLSHGYPVHGCAIYSHGRFRTPLGDIEIDEEIADKIMQRNNKVVNLPEAHACEHSLEIQLPFLQKMLPDFRIVPLLLQDDSPANHLPLGEAIVEAIRGRSALLIGSTDLCHYPAYDDAVKSDRVVIEAIKHFDTDVLREQMENYLRTHVVSNLHCMMCSTGAVYTTLDAARQLGGTRIEVLKAANSGDIPNGRRDQVVGYMAAAIYC